MRLITALKSKSSVHDRDWLAVDRSGLSSRAHAKRSRQPNRTGAGCSLGRLCEHQQPRHSSNLEGGRKGGPTCGSIVLTNKTLRRVFIRKAKESEWKLRSLHFCQLGGKLKKKRPDIRPEQLARKRFALSSRVTCQKFTIFGFRRQPNLSVNFVHLSVFFNFAHVIVSMHCHGYDSFFRRTCLVASHSLGCPSSGGSACWVPGFTLLAFHRRSMLLNRIRLPNCSPSRPNRNAITLIASRIATE